MNHGTNRAYPAPPRTDDVERLAGLSFPDPFRRLEDGKDPAVAAWQRAQAELADAYVATVPHVDGLRERVAHFAGSGHAWESMPRFAGGRWFWPAYAPGANQARLVVADRPLGDGEVLFDPAGHGDEQGRIPFLSWLSPSPDGRTVAIGLCYDGSEGNTIRLIDVRSRRILADRPPQLLRDNWMGGAQWLPDSTGFLYVALDGEPQAHRLRVFRHDLGKPARTTPEPLPVRPRPGHDYLGVFVSRDGRWALTSQNLVRPKPVAVLDLTDEAASWRSFVTDLDATVIGHAIADDYIAVTDHDAPRGRLVAIPLGASAGAGPAHWRELVPESDAVLRSVTPVGDLLYLTELVDTYSRVRIVDHDGAEVGQVPLPDKGALAEPPFQLMTLVPRGHPEEYLFAFSSFTESSGLYRHRPDATGVETLREPHTRLDAVVEDRWATSADGARVPYHLIRRADVSDATPQPTLIYGYGGFNTPFHPAFPPAATAAFVEAGGVFVHAHLRGGADLGTDWWQGGRMARKQNSYADLYAIAEDLIGEGRTAPDRLAVSGASHGGLLSGVAITQRPDLWRAAVPRVPRLDLLGSCREPYGRGSVTQELGDPDDPDTVALIATYSPYQLIKDGTDYPAVYLDVGDTDPRCPAWHGRKFAARLQEATSGDRPILLRVWENVGHGWATARDIEVKQNIGILAFLVNELGMVVAARNDEDSANNAG